jgi:hypothetical protein
VPAFVSAPPSITPRRGITAGLPSYSFGSFPLGVQPARLAVTSVACTSNVITLGVKLLEGNIPTTANNITVTGTVAGGSAVNVTNTALTGVTITPSTGVGTITYALTLANLATTPDGGQVFVLATDIGETTAVAKGLQFALAPDGGYGLTLAWACTAATVALQLEGSVDDVDAQYAIIGTSQTTLTGSVVAQVPNNVRFVRVNTTAFTGGPGTLWAKIYQSTNAGN